MEEITIWRWGSMIAFVFMGVVIGLSINIVSEVTSCKPRMTFQQKQVADIKLCTDNGLQAYQGGSGRYYCKP